MPNVYDNIDRPFTGQLERSGLAELLRESASQPVQSPYDIGAESMAGESLTDITIKNWIRSQNYKPQKTGFIIDGRAGYIECNKLFAGKGGIAGSSIDIPDKLSIDAMHVDAHGNTWWGADVETGYAGARAYILSTGDAYFRAVDGTNGKSIVVRTNENIQTAIDEVHAAGGGEVILKNGTHYPISDLVLYNNVNLRGQNSESTIIDFGGQSYGIVVAGSNQHIDGTISVTSGSAVITGTGTNFTAEMVGRSIMLSGLWYPIAAFYDASTIAIGLYYSDETLTNVDYQIATPINDCYITNMTIKNSLGAAVVMWLANEIHFKDLNIQSSVYAMDLSSASNFTVLLIDAAGNGYGMALEDCHFFTLDNSGSVYTTLGQGIAMEYCTNFNLTGNFILYSAQSGVILSYCGKGLISGSTSSLNSLNGYLLEYCEDIIMNGAGAFSNGQDGIRLTEDCSKNIITNSPINNNVTYGISIETTDCEDNIVRSNQYGTNGTGGLRDGGTRTVTDQTIQKQIIYLTVFEGTGDVSTGDGKKYFTVPPELNGMNLIDIDIAVYTASSNDKPTVNIYNITDAQEMLSTGVTIDENEYSSYGAYVPAAINTSYDDVATGDRLRIDVDAAGTGTKGLDVRLTFATPL